MVSESLVSSDPSTGDALFGGNTSAFSRCLYCFPGSAGREIVWRLKFTRAEAPDCFEWCNRLLNCGCGSMFPLLPAANSDGDRRDRRGSSRGPPRHGFVRGGARAAQGTAAANRGPRPQIPWRSACSHSFLPRLPDQARKPYTITKRRERWTEDEHGQFLEALQLHGRAWRRIQGTQPPFSFLLHQDEERHSHSSSLLVRACVRACSAHRHQDCRANPEPRAEVLHQGRVGVTISLSLPVPL